MPYPKTITEIQKAKAKLEADVLSLIKEFEFETATSVDSILCWPATEKLVQNRLQVRVRIEALADDVQIVSTETGIAVAL